MRATRSGTPLFTALCALVTTLFVAQIWLLSTTLDAVLAGRSDVLVPGAVASVALFAMNAALLWLGLRFDRDAQTEERRG